MSKGRLALTEEYYVKFEDMRNPKTFLPGIKAKHAIITATCLRNRGIEGAVDDALSRLGVEALNVIRNWPDGSTATFHLVLTVDRNGRMDCES